MNREVFRSLREARIILESWRCEYNEKPPHRSLFYETPVKFATSCETPLIAQRKHKSTINPNSYPKHDPTSL